MKKMFCFEDFDYEYQCWVILAIGSDKSEVEEKGSELCGGGYDSQCDTRIRTIYVEG